ncbi:metallophosphoesterase family protein [Phycisphaera mikurensis]|uniref:Putative hydrolase n=1 Tax=Phycisphaera mikurensis (strain NBRC 102666 / KCTC 22515 / FYK2301M01) TaxID=1142394 RepID=I0IF64_PHYMF|nr:DNA repair exonuclease [Phycisphaera mikurensis]MBB6440702.1 DNA repair exonuclease SbcCD nuclease subunit [Phycisphaera mikurensis]BAM03902.1 putative hydrolase [Phycisphaera mikurensis NBRC 102666]
MLTFVHAADLHLGQPLHFLGGGDAAPRVRQLRLEAIDRIGALAAERGAAFVLVAGDLFDGGLVDDRTVAAACGKLGSVAVPVRVLPGNHDLSGVPGGVFGREVWAREKPANVSVLAAREPLFLDEHGAVILPAPADPASPADPTAHLTRSFGSGRAGAIRIGLAHGGTTDFAEISGGRSATIAPGRAASAGLDYLALGDWHGFQTLDARTAYAGSPEPTSFVNNDSGNALVVRIAGPGAVPEVEPVKLARTRWLREEARLREASEVEALDARLQALAAEEDTLLRLELDAALPAAAAARLDRVLDAAGHRLLHLRLRDAAGGAFRPRVLADAATLEEAAASAPGFVRAAIAELSAEEDDAEAAEALVLLQRLLAEAASC